jgi:hypothetical protein
MHDILTRVSRFNTHVTRAVVCRVHATARRISSNVMRIRSRAFTQVRVGCEDFKLTPHISHLTPHTSLLTPHSSLLTPHSSHLTPHTSQSIQWRLATLYEGRNGLRRLKKNVGGAELMMVQMSQAKTQRKIKADVMRAWRLLLLPPACLPSLELRAKSRMKKEAVVRWRWRAYIAVKVRTRRLVMIAKSQFISMFRVRHATNRPVI